MGHKHGVNIVKTISRRHWLKLTTALGVAAMTPGAWSSQPLRTRPIPRSGEPLPMVGLGSSATFRKVASSDDVSALKAVMKTLFEHGGSVIDTAPSYGEAEAVAGRLVHELGALDQTFWATKLNVAPRGGGAADARQAWAQVENSFERIGKTPVDLIQVHNLGDVPTQMGILKELRETGRVRYIGVTSTRESQYDDLARVMREEPIDFIGIDYAVDNRRSAEQILPLAKDRGIGVLIYAPFGRTRLWKRTAGRALPEWAEEFQAHSWAQFFLKFVAAHPAVTVITPATSKPNHMVDNLGAAMGALPDADHLKRMIEYVEALPPA
jgi:aryl-alcohol dehydrogenase-like predicted oxidoreductase